jgi:protein-S-isoprenylcysteine O-methyltransferase Ste14
MTAAFPRFETWLLVAQIMGGIAVGAAWLRSDSTSGWPRVALVFLIAGGLLGVAASMALRGSFRIRPTPREGARLVQAGVYRWLRHPMYVAVMLVFAAAACSRPSTWVLLTSGLNLVLYLGKARYEESVLMHHYQGYAQYRESTLGVKPLPGPGTRRRSRTNANPDQPDSPSGPTRQE